jgi:hypothetical protein
MPNTAADYRKQAERAQRLADEATDLETKREWLLLAEGYRNPAASVERSDLLRDATRQETKA